MPGKPEESLLVEAVNYAGPEMPPTGKLAPGEDRRPHPLDLPGRPLAQPRSHGGARHINQSEAIAPKTTLTAADRALWSLQPVRKPPIPVLTKLGASAWAGWSRNPIDHFILKALRDHGLTPAPEADKPTLIRRATFDLTGLPPTPEEVDAFLADQCTRCLRAADRPAAGFAALRPALGEALARSGSVRRVGRLSPGRLSPPSLALP